MEFVPPLPVVKENNYINFGDSSSCMALSLKPQTGGKGAETFTNIPHPNQQQHEQDYHNLGFFFLLSNLQP